MRKKKRRRRTKRRMKRMERRSDHVGQAILEEGREERLPEKARFVGREGKGKSNSKRAVEVNIRSPGECRPALQEAANGAPRS